MSTPLWIAVVALVVLVLALLGLGIWWWRRRGKGETATEPALVDDVSWIGRRNKPCVLVTGLEGSGVESLLNALAGEGRPLTAPVWRVAGEALIYGVPEETFSSADGEPWERAVRTLARRRAARPLDGVILAVPAQAERTANEMQARERLDRLRERLGFVAPVYVVVTGGGPAFAPLERVLRGEQREEMIGWSAGHRLDAAFSAEWVDEAFDALAEALARIQLTLLGGTRPPAEREELLSLPAAAAALRAPLIRLLEALFRPVAGEDAHLLRGLYLCPGGAFVRDLWERKVLAEIRLARPAAGHFSTRTRSERVAQVLAAVLAVVLTAGTWWSANRLSWLRDSHVRPLLDALAHGGGGAGVARAFDFLATVEALEVQPFRSVFLPGSWNDPVDERIERILAPAFQRLVVEACHRGLEERLRLERPAAAAGEEEAAEEATPDLQLRFQDDPNYAALAGYLQRAAQLEEHLTLYGKLRDRQPAGFMEVEKILRYLRGDASPRAARRVTRAMERRLMADVEWPPVAGRDRHLDDAGRRTVELAEAFLASWIGGGLLPAAIDQVTARVESFEQGVDGGDAAFAELDQWIEQTNAALESGAWDWAVAGFDRRRWGVLGQALDETPFESAAVVDAIEKAGRAQHHVLAEQLRTVGRSAGGPVVEMAGKVRLAAPVRALGTAVAQLRSFAAQTREAATLRTMPAGMGYVWNTAELRQAAAVETAYQEFLRNAVTPLPPRFQAAMRQIGAARARNAALARVVAARQPGRVVWKEGADAESTLLPEIRNTAEAVEQYAPVGQMLDAMGALGERENLRRLLAAQAAELLAAVDREFDRSPAYRPLGKARDNAGAMTAALYDARSKQDVKRFLEGERERLENFTRGYALPLVSALEKLGALDRTRAQRWRTLNAALTEYASAKPGNPLKGLETFIEEGLDRIQPEARCQAPADGPGGVDLFSTAERSIREQASALCVARLLGQYRQLAETFNAKLAGRYPFTADGRPADANGADPRDVEAVFEAVDRLGPAVAALVQSDYRYGEPGRRAADFLRRMAALRPLFTTPEGEAGPVLGVTADFRPGQTQEVGANQVMDWVMRIGDQVLTPAGGSPARWKHGDRTRMEFRYAKDSPWWPAPTGAGGGPMVNGRTVSFDFRHPWSLLQMLREHAASPADLLRGGAEIGKAASGAHLLRFRIPNQGPGAEVPPASVLFVRVNLEAVAGRKGQAAVAPALFPDQAPLLDQPLMTRSALR